MLEHTLNLPKTLFPMRANAAKREPHLIPRTTTELYRWQQSSRSSKGNSFVLHDGPPYANGDLHIGHLLNKTLKDIINRYQLLKGKRIDYIPGWDCHGLPIELKALQGSLRTDLSPTDIRKRARACASEAIARQSADFERWGVLADWDFSADDYDGAFYKTMSKEYEAAQLEVFREMILKNIVYRGRKPVYWSPSSRTALAEAELEYADRVSESVFISFPLKCTGTSLLEKVWTDDPKRSSSSSLSALVWTTTPWTIPANMALCVHPEFEYSIVRRRDDGDGNSSHFLVATKLLRSVHEALRDVHDENGQGGFFITETDGHLFNVVGTLTGADLVGAEFGHPLNERRTSPILLGTHVTTEAGTGIVHTAPGHGIDDYVVWSAYQKEQGLNDDILCPVDDDGCFTPAVDGLVSSAFAPPEGRFCGKNVLEEGNLMIIDALGTSERLVMREKYLHRYPHDWRTKKPVITRSTEQWFANVEMLHDDAASALREVRMVPPVSTNRLQSMVRGRKEWCISRQRVWGVPIPVFYHKMEEGRVLATSESLKHIEALVREHGTDCWWTMEVKELLPPSWQDRSEEWIKCTDTLDVWFDSGASWASVLRRTGMKMPADLYLEGSDQHRGWFQSSLLTKLAATNDARAPYTQLVTHGFVLDENERKMSKSLGNIIQPEVVINGGRTKSNPANGGKKKTVVWPAYGVDTLRLWVASTDYTHDVVIGPTSIEKVSDILRKVRNTARFVLGNLNGAIVSKADAMEGLTPLDHLMLHRLDEFVQESEHAYEAYNYRKVYDLIQQLITRDLSSFYMEVSKDRLYCDAKYSPSRQACQFVLTQALNALTTVCSPIIPLTCEDIHQHRLVDQSRSSRDTVNGARTGNPEGVYDVSSFFKTAAWPTTFLDIEMEYVELICREWDLVHTVRLRSNRMLEMARRKNKLIGVNMEARLVVEELVEDEAQHPTDLLDAFDRFSSQLEDIFGVSQVEFALRPSGEPVEQKAAGAHSFRFTERLKVGETVVDVTIAPALGEKCRRCWKYSEQVAPVSCTTVDGTEEAVSVCPRCAEVVNGD